MTTIFPADLLYLLSRLKSQSESSRFQTPDLNPIKSENTASIKKTQSYVLSYQCRILFGINGVTLCLLLIAVAFCTSQGVRLFASCLQIPAEGFGLEHISIRNCSFTLLCLLKAYSGFLSPFHRSNHPSWPARTIEASARRRRSWRRTCR